MGKRVFLIVMDSMGIGEMPDAADWGDAGSNTLGAIRNLPQFSCPNLTAMGLFNIEGVGGGVPSPTASFARMREASMGKDTTIGHWEMMGILSAHPFPTFSGGFPAHIIEEFERLTGRGVLCNLPYSGIDVLRDYGEEHLRTGKLIVYTSADSVFQVAAHEDIVPVQELYGYCEQARSILTGDYGVGRVIARPFTGKHPFTRLPLRHDYSIEPTDTTAVDLLLVEHYDTIAVGKIFDIFAGRGFTECHRTVDNADGMQKTLALADRDFEGLCFVNLVDFDSSFGHRNDSAGYAAAMTEFDTYLGMLLAKLREDDILIVTADHGCDPSTPSSDHSREYTPMLITGKQIRAGVDLGTRQSFADIGATVMEHLGAKSKMQVGESFLGAVRNGVIL